MEDKGESKRGGKHSIDVLISPRSDEDDQVDVKAEAYDDEEDDDDDDDDVEEEDEVEETEVSEQPGSVSNKASARRKSQEKVASYTEMIARAIFQSENNMATLQEIYNFLSARYPVLKSRGKSWKNSVRHTLSLNEWFIKIPRMDNGKCCYWSVHPVYLQRFKRGDFQKQRKTSSKSILPRKSDMRAYDMSPSCQTNPAPPLYPPDITGGMCSQMFPNWPGLRPFDNLPHLHNYHPYNFGHANFFPPTGFIDGFANPEANFFSNGSSNNNKSSDGEKSSPDGSSPDTMLKPTDIGLSLGKAPDMGFCMGRTPDMGMHLTKGYLDCLKFGTPLPPMMTSSPGMNFPYGRDGFTTDLQRQFQLKMENGQL